MMIVDHIDDDELAQRGRAGDDEAALMLARRVEDLTFPEFISRFAQGWLTTAIFDRFSEAYDKARAEREIDALDDEFDRGRTSS